LCESIVETTCRKLFYNFHPRMKLRRHGHNNSYIEDEEGNYACDRDVNSLEYLRLLCYLCERRNDECRYLVARTV